MSKPKPPCLGCEQRVSGCHSTCNGYIEFRKALDEYNATIIENRKAEQLVTEFQVERCMKTRNRGLK